MKYYSAILKKKERERERERERKKERKKERKERNLAICNDMDGTRGYYAK